VGERKVVSGNEEGTVKKDGQDGKGWMEAEGTLG